MRRALALVLVAAAATGCAREQEAVRLPGQEPLSATYDLAPRSAQFGDAVTATIRVLLDPTRVDERSLRLRTSFEPWRARTTTARVRVGGLVEVTYRLRLTCLTGPCVSDERQARTFFPDGQLAWREGGEQRLQLLAWPELEVATRLPRTYVPPSAGDQTPLPWRAAADVPEPSYRVRPALLRNVLLALGALLVGGSLVLAAAALRRPRARRELPPLERALAQLERARTAAERRAALEAVAAELHPALAAAARELAWSPEAPSEPAAQELSARAREARA